MKRIGRVQETALDLIVVGGQGEEVAGLAELGADSSRKLWVKVDKDIRAVRVDADRRWLREWSFS